MARVLLDEIESTASYIKSLKGCKVFDAAVKDRSASLKALVGQTPLTASAAAEVVNNLRKIDWPNATTDKLIGCVHDRMVYATTIVDTSGWKYQDFTSMPNFLTGPMWASSDIINPLCMLAATMSLHTMSEDTAAVLTALVMAQKLGLEEAINARAQIQYDMLQDIKKKVKRYNGKSQPLIIPVLPASPDLLLLEYAETYHSAYPDDGPVAMSLDKSRFDKLVGLIPRRSSLPVPRMGKWSTWIKPEVVGMKMLGKPASLSACCISSTVFGVFV